MLDSLSRSQEEWARSCIKGIKRALLPRKVEKLGQRVKEQDREIEPDGLHLRYAAAQTCRNRIGRRQTERRSDLVDKTVLRAHHHFRCPILPGKGSRIENLRCC